MSSIFDDNSLLVTDSSPDVFLGTPSACDVSYSMDSASAGGAAFRSDGVMTPLELREFGGLHHSSSSFVPDDAEALKLYFDAQGDVMLRVLSEYPDLSGKIIADNISMFIGMLLLEKASCVDISAALKQRGHDLSTARSVFRSAAFCAELSRACPRSVAALLSGKPEFRAAFSYSHFPEFHEVCLSRPDLFPLRRPFADVNAGLSGSGRAAVMFDSGTLPMPPDSGSPRSADADNEFSPDSSNGQPQAALLHDAVASSDDFFQRHLHGLAASDPGIVDDPWTSYLKEAGMERLPSIFDGMPPSDVPQQQHHQQQQYQQYHQQQLPSSVALVPIKHEVEQQAQLLRPVSPVAAPLMTFGAGSGGSRFVAGGRLFDYEERQATIGIDPKRACRSHQIGQPNATRPFTCHFKLFLENRRFDHNCQMVHVNDDNHPNKLVFNIRNDRDINVHLVVALLVSQDGRETSWVPVDGLRLHRAHASKEDRSRRRGPKRSPPWHIEAFSINDDATGMELNCAQVELTFAIIVSSFTQNKKEPRKFKVSIGVLEFPQYPELKIESEPFITSQRMPGNKDKHASIESVAPAPAVHHPQALLEDGGRKKTKLEPGAGGAVWRQTVGGVSEELRPYPKLISPMVHYAGLGADTISGHVIYQNVKRIEGGMREMWDFSYRPVNVHFATTPDRQIAPVTIDVQQVDMDNGCIFMNVPPHPEAATFEVAISHDATGPLFNPDKAVLFRYVDAGAFREAFGQSTAGLGPFDDADFGGGGGFDNSSSFGGYGTPPFGGFHPGSNGNSHGGGPSHSAPAGGPSGRQHRVSHELGGDGHSFKEGAIVLADGQLDDTSAGLDQGDNDDDVDGDESELASDVAPEVARLAAQYTTLSMSDADSQQALASVPPPAPVVDQPVAASHKHAREPLTPVVLSTVDDTPEPLERVAARYSIRRQAASGAFFGRLDDVPDEKLPPPDVFRSIIRANWRYRLNREPEAQLRETLSKPSGTHGYTPLHCCVLVGLPDVAEEMLWRGANVNARDRSGSTPLHLCAQQCDTEAADLLYTYQADLRLRDVERRTPVQRVPTHLRRVWASRVSAPALAVEDDSSSDEDGESSSWTTRSTTRYASRFDAASSRVPPVRPPPTALRSSQTRIAGQKIPEPALTHPLQSMSDESYQPTPDLPANTDLRVMVGVPSPWPPVGPLSSHGLLAANTAEIRKTHSSQDVAIVVPRFPQARLPHVQLAGPPRPASAPVVSDEDFSAMISDFVFVEPSKRRLGRPASPPSLSEQHKLPSPRRLFVPSTPLSDLPSLSPTSLSAPDLSVFRKTPPQLSQSGPPAGAPLFDAASFNGGSTSEPRRRRSGGDIELTSNDKLEELRQTLRQDKKQWHEDQERIQRWEANFASRVQAAKQSARPAARPSYQPGSTVAKSPQDKCSIM